MANSSQEFWTVNNVSLHTYGWSVATKGGRLNAPGLRGDNAAVAGVPGELWLPKTVDARTLRLPMWVCGFDPDTGAAVDDPVRRFNDSYAYLRQALWIPEAQFTLTRRWWRTGADGNAVLAIADAYGQLDQGCDLDVTMTGPSRGTFDVAIRLAHPFFYSPTVTTEFSASRRAATVVNAGDYTAFSRHMYVDFVGPLTSPRLTNARSSGSNIYCGLTGSVAAGETVTLDIANFNAISTRTGSATKTNRSGAIYNSGTRPWMAMLRGNNTMAFTGSGSGRVVLRFRPPYL